MDEAARFWAKVDVADCWRWTAAKTPDGYGIFRLTRGKQVRAHRWAYEHLVGAIPAGLTVDHLCRVRNCVNPDHMDLVPPGTNTLRGYGPSALNRRRERCAKGHEFRQRKKQRVCWTCQLEHINAWSAKQRRAAGVPVGKGAHNKAKTECSRGHLFDEANTYITPKGYRQCRTCIRAQLREFKRKKREALRATASQSG
jgi:hypothetical protein